MKRFSLTLAALTLATPAFAADPAPSPGEIVAAAPPAEWVKIAPTDLLVMDLAPDAKGKPRRVVIQLMPPPFSQGWIGNIRKLAAAHWWDGLAVVRVQDNYVAQWGDPDGEDKAKAKALPAGLATVPEGKYATDSAKISSTLWTSKAGFLNGAIAGGLNLRSPPAAPFDADKEYLKDRYAPAAIIANGWPLGISEAEAWPVHCYGMVGVGRNMSPDTGSGAELYTVIGHAPRHLDRNIALVGRVIEGIEHLSSLPRGTAALGFYETSEERTRIVSVRLGSEMEADPVPRFEYLSTESETFARYAEARANRRDPFFIKPAGGADICNIPVPVRRVK